MRDKRRLPPTSVRATAGAWGYIQPPQSGDSRTRRRPPCEPTLTLTLTLALTLTLTLTLSRLYPAELAGRSNAALPLMMKRLLPPGLLGLNLAATVAACMSSLDSVAT